jgi:hypothetical protein
MIFSFRKFRKRMKFAVQLLVFTILIYYVLRAATNWIVPMERYKVPSGHFLKVFQQEALADQSQTLKERIAMFYWFGE